MMMQEFKIVACAAFASRSFLHDVLWGFVVHNQQSACEFSRPQNSVQAVEIHAAGSEALLSNFHYWENGGCFPSACSSQTWCHAPITCSVRQPCHSQSPFWAFVSSQISFHFWTKLLLLTVSFFSNVALVFPPFVWPALDFSWWQLFHEKKKKVFWWKTGTILVPGVCFLLSPLFSNHL